MGNRTGRYFDTPSYRYWELDDSTTQRVRRDDIESVCLNGDLSAYHQLHSSYATPIRRDQSIIVKRFYGE